MKNFFSVEGKFYTVTSKIVDLILLTLLWIVGCIPIVTILTSTASMYHTTVKCIRFDRGKVWEEFKEAYKKNLNQGVLLTVLFLAAGLVIAYLDRRVLALSKSGTDAVFYMTVAMLILTVLFLINVLWLIPVFSRFANTLGKIVQLTFVISIRYLIKSILMLLLLAVTVLLIWISLPLVIICPALFMLALSYLTEPVLHRYMPRQEEDNGDWRYGHK